MTNTVSPRRCGARNCRNRRPVISRTLPPLRSLTDRASSRRPQRGSHIASGLILPHDLGRNPTPALASPRRRSQPMRSIGRPHDHARGCERSCAGQAGAYVAGQRERTRQDDLARVIIQWTGWNTRGARCLGDLRIVRSVACKSGSWFYEFLCLLWR